MKKFKLFGVLLLSVAVLGACSSNESSTTSDSSSATAQSSSEVKKDETYESILADYTAKIQAEAPKLVDEYNAEYPSNTNGLEGLAELSNAKITKLAELSNEGIEKMAKLNLTSGSGDTSEYQEWATKLTDVYTSEAQKITDAYTQSAQ